MELYDSIDTLKGIGGKKKEIFGRYGINTLEDLLFFFPKSYEDRRKTVKIDSLKAGENVLTEGCVVSSHSNSAGRRKSLFTLRVSDDTGILNIAFFNSFYTGKNFPKGSRFTFYGKVTSDRKGNLQMVHPEFYREGDANDIRGIVPVYPLIDKISQNEIRKYQRQIVPLYDKVQEWLPENIISEYNLAGAAFTVKNSHFPADGTRYRMAKYRMIFEEFIVMELGLLYMQSSEPSDRKGVSIKTDCADRFIASLPFEFTEGQKQAWDSIASDLESDRIMNRLLQGDVGSGKTAVAEAAMFAAAENGYQSIMMAPTEILAAQHYRTLKHDFEPYGIEVGLLCGSMKASEKKKTAEKLASGEIQILTGTHAVLQSGITLKNPGLVITDEQHRFGVNQRKILSEKGEKTNVMVMTATPIPRTLAVVLYGNFDISQIRTMPHGRKPVTTVAGNSRNRNKIYNFTEKELSAGRQAYVIAPLIEESEKIDAVSADELYEELRKRFRNYRVALVHGSMKQEEKDRVMRDFADGKTDLLVSTVVVEVGINVPNASVMVIENCERFGLAQLHQLRGRVGRGGSQSYCFLISDSESEISRERIKILCDSNDGFEIAEEDLRLRGPGEIFGTRQHGLPEMRFGDIVRHADILETAKKAACEVLKDDPGLISLENKGLRDKTVKMFGGDITLNL